jgi:C4-type Zn-finger protein
MKMINKYGMTVDAVPGIIPHFEGLCPVCGTALKLKRIKKQRNMHRRSLRSRVCEDCGYAEYDSNEREQAITDGIFDDEL